MQLKWATAGAKITTRAPWGKADPKTYKGRGSAQRRTEIHREERQRSSQESWLFFHLCDKPLSLWEGPRFLFLATRGGLRQRAAQGLWDKMDLFSGALKMLHWRSPQGSGETLRGAGGLPLSRPSISSAPGPTHLGAPCASSLLTWIPFYRLPWSRALNTG